MLTFEYALLKHLRMWLGTGNESSGNQKHHAYVKHSLPNVPTLGIQTLHGWPRSMF